MCIKLILDVGVRSRHEKSYLDMMTGVEKFALIKSLLLPGPIILICYFNEYVMMMQSPPPPSHQIIYMR